MVPLNLGSAFSPEMLPYRLFCVILGQDVDLSKAFSVTLDETKLVEDLQNEIKKNRKSLAEFETLVLYKVNLNGSDKQGFKKDLDDILHDWSKATELAPTLELSEVFQSEPSKNKVHILIELPPGDLINSRVCSAVSDTILTAPSHDPLRKPGSHLQTHSIQGSRRNR